MYLNFSSRSLLLLSLLFLSAVSLAQPASDLKTVNLDITTQLGDQQIYHAGDKLSFMLSLDEDAYVYLFYQDSENNLLQLLPNAQNKQNFFKAGLYITVPDSEAAFSFRVQAPFGSDRIWAFAIDHQIPVLQGVILENGLVMMSKTIDQIRSELKTHAGKVFDQSSKEIITRDN